MLIHLFLELLELASDYLELFFIGFLAGVEFLGDHGFCVFDSFLFGMLKVNFLLVLDNLKSVGQLFVLSFKLGNLSRLISLCGRWLSLFLFTKDLLGCIYIIFSLLNG